MSVAEKGRMMGERQLLIFDFDGVIINSEPLMRHAYAETCKACGVVDSPSVESFLGLMGMPLPDIVHQLSLPGEFVRCYQQLCREKISLVTPYEGITSLLSHARQRYQWLGLMTGKDRQRTLVLLEHFSLRDYFDGIVCGDDPFPGKPDPAGVQSLMARFHVRPCETAMIGDSPIDIKCGRAAGVLTLGAGWGFCDSASLQEAGADRIFERLPVFEQWLEEGLGNRLSDRAVTSRNRHSYVSEEGGTRG